MTNFEQKITDIAVMTLTSRHRNGRHSSRPKKDLIFAPPHFLKGTEEKQLPPLNFLSRFLSPASFSTFAAYNFFCVEKNTHKKLLATPPAAKELNTALKTKTDAKKFSIAATGALKKYFVILDIMGNYFKTTKMIIQTTLLSLLIPMLFGCSKEKETVIGNNWQVESIKVHADSALKYPPQGQEYKLSFENKKKYSFKIGSNTSAGKVSFQSNNTIKFDGSITYVMWDSPFSENVFNIFSKVNKYQTTGETLTLIDDNGGVINFIKF